MRPQSNLGPTVKRVDVCAMGALDLKRGSYPPRQVNDSKKGSNGPAGSRSGKLHSERGVDSMGPKP